MSDSKSFELLSPGSEFETAAEEFERGMRRQAGATRYHVRRRPPCSSCRQGTGRLGERYAPHSAKARKELAPGARQRSDRKSYRAPKFLAPTRVGSGPGEVKKLWSTANGSVVRLGNFDIGRYQLKPEHKNYLLLEVLPVLLAGGSIRLIGLASRSGSFDRNKDLSRSRVDEVVTSLRNYLGSGPRVATGFSFGEAAAALAGVPDGTEHPNWRSVILIHWRRPDPPPDYTYFVKIISFMYSEMIKNAQSKQVAEIKDSFFSTKALFKWRNLVGPGRRWDHKPKLMGILPGCESARGDPRHPCHFAITGDPNHRWYYDIWSNIHYGYVGRAAGFAGKVLQWGHQLAASGRTDPLDVETVQIGIDLWNRYGLALTPEQLRQEILRRKNRLLQVQQTPQYKKAQAEGGDPNFKHIIPR